LSKLSGRLIKIFFNCAKSKTPLLFWLRHKEKFKWAS